MKIGKSIKQPESLVVDASVAVKWFTDEDGMIISRRLLKEMQEGRKVLYAPNLLIYEVANVLNWSKKLEEERISIALNSIFDSDLRLIELDTSLTAVAVNLMTAHRMSFYDASYAALAKMLKIPLITADAKHFGKLKEIKILGLK